MDMSTLFLNHMWIGPSTPPWGRPKYGADVFVFDNITDGPKCSIVVSYFYIQGDL